MRIAALYDIHGNLPALAAVLEDIDRLGGVDRIVVGGDVVPGPMFRETIDRLIQLEIPVDAIQGNCEMMVGELRRDALTEPIPPQARAIMEWTASTVSAEHARILESWPRTLRLHAEGIGDVLFCHGTPRHPNEIMLATTPDDMLQPLLDPLGAALVVCGHTHMPFDRTVGSTRVVNAGSIGMPFGEPGADWLLIGPDVQLRHTMYDLDAAAAAIRKTDYPDREEFANTYVLHPPPAAQMMDAFTRAQLRYGPQTT